MGVMSFKSLFPPLNATTRLSCSLKRQKGLEVNDNLSIEQRQIGHTIDFVIYVIRMYDTTSSASIFSLGLYDYCYIMYKKFIH